MPRTRDSGTEQNGSSYVTVAGESVSGYNMKGSRFIGVAQPCRCESGIQSNLSALATRYPDATHYCYAARYGGCEPVDRSSDNGEPSGTAGKPIMAVIKGSGLSDVMVTVIRYFGGTLLGTGGLVHCYTETASLALGSVETVRYVRCSAFSFSMDYSRFSQFEGRMRDILVGRPECTYTDNVQVKVRVEHGREDEFLARFSDFSERRIHPISLGQEYVPR